MTVTNDQACAPKRRSSTSPAAVGENLRIALTRITRQLRAQRGEADLVEGHFGVLTTLHRHGAMTPGELADHENVRPPSMTRTVNALAEQGLVIKVEDPGDGRRVMVELTEAGGEEVRETRRRRDAWLTRQLRDLTPEERETLAAACELMSRISRG